MRKTEQNGDGKLPFYPLWDYILAKAIGQNKTEGGIILPDGVNPNDLKLAQVVAVGPGTFRESGEWIPNPIQVGDLVYLMARMQPFTIKFKGETYMCWSARDTVALANRDAMDGYTPHSMAAEIRPAEDANA